LECEALRKRLELVNEQLRSLGRYNQELLDKYEPPSSSEDEEDEDEEAEETPIKEAAPTETAFLTGKRKITSPFAEKASEGTSVTLTGATQGGCGSQEDAQGVAPSAVTEEPVAAAITLPATAVIGSEEEELTELVAVQAADSVFEIRPRNSEDAIS
jgi:hypothetical protein